jgi:hypothetical protein
LLNEHFLRVAFIYVCRKYRIGRIGEGHRQAAQRRAWAKREEEKMVEERRAFWNSNSEFLR